MSLQPRPAAAAVPTRVPSPRAAAGEGSGRPPLSGDLVPGFQILGELGRGAHSTVYRVRRFRDDGARDDGARDDGAEYALKVMDITWSGSEQALVMFRREAALLSSVAHPGLTVIHEVGEVDGCPYLVMDLVDGQPLSRVIEGGPLPADQVVRLAQDVVAPLAAVHRKGLVHRDIKPDNIIVTSGGARLIDFGLAARETGDQATVTVGTLAYSPPEQSGLLRRPVDQRSDLYSLGVVLFECLSGNLPFSAADVGELLRLHAVASPPDLLVEVPGTPAGLAAIVAALLAKDPDDRYASSDALAADLARLAVAPDEPLVPRRAVRDDRGPGREPLSGRGQELAQLGACWAEVRAGRGRTAVVRGAAGQGKSRLAAELGRQVAAADLPVLHGTSSPDDPVPLAPLRAALGAFLADVKRRDPADRERIAQRIRTAAGSSAGLLSGLVPALGAVLDGPEVEREGQFARALAGFLADLARECGGLLLVLDDLQWLDPATAQVLAHLSDLLADAPLMVLATARDDEASLAATDAVLAALSGTVSVDLPLGPLDEQGVAELIQAMFPAGAADPGLAALVRLLTVRGHGNPFVIQEYLLAIVDAGLLRPWWGSWVFDEQALDDLELPRDALGLVLSRVQHLAPAARELLTTAAAIGTRFAPELLAGVQDVPLEQVLDAVVEATGRGLVAPLAEAEGARYTFLHDRIREALLDALGEDATAGLHQRIAEAMDARPAPAQGHDADHVYAVAHHYLAGRDPHSRDRAFAACWAAGRLALDDHAPADAVAFLERAAGLGVDVDSAFLFTLGDALRRNGQYGLARERLEQALASEPTPTARARILGVLADVHRATYRTEDAIAAVARGLAELGVPLPRNRARLILSAAALFTTGLVLRATGRLFRVSRDADRLRYRLIAALHEVAVYVGVLRLTPRLLLLQNMRAQFWVNRIGAGAQYARSQGTFGFACIRAGLRRSGGRAFARAAADPAGSDPGVRALIAHYRGRASYLGYHDNGDDWRATLARDGQWLDVGIYCEAASQFSLDAALEGRIAEAAQWLALGQRRLALQGGDAAAMVFAEPAVLACQGRPAEAMAALARAEQADPSPTRSMLLALIVTRLAVLAEQREFGEPFQAAAAQFAALDVPLSLMTRQQRWVFALIAAGRVEQCRIAAGSDQFAARSAAAEAAVRALDAAARGEQLTAAAAVARADLLVLAQRPLEALQVLDRLAPVHHPDAPRLAFDVARVRARALAALGGAAESRRAAQAARVIAEDQGAEHRAGWVTAEFDLPGTGRSGGSGSPGAQVSRWGGTPAGMTVSELTGPGRTVSGLTRSGLTVSGLTVSGLTRSGLTAPGDSAVAAPSITEVALLNQRLTALQQMSVAASRVIDPVALARIALDETIRILSAERAFLFLASEDAGLSPHLGRDVTGQDLNELTGYSTSLVERVYHTREPLVVTGTEEGAALGAQSVVLHGLRSIIVAPLELEGRLLGVVYLDSQIAKGLFTRDDIGILIALTAHLATSMETARAAQLEITVQTAQRQRDLADTLHQALEAMAAAWEPAQVLAELLAWAGPAVSSAGGWLIQSGPASSPESFVLSTLDQGELSARSVPADPELRALTALTHPVVGSPDVVPAALREELATAPAWLAVPLRRDDRQLGVLVLAAGPGDASLPERLEVAATLVAQAMTAHDRATLFAQVQALAVADELTGIPNRRRFFEMADRDVATALRAGRVLLGIMIDIDHFKQVNDTFGHPTGDDVIRVVARRLSEQIRKTDPIGRYGGEEFAVILPDVGSAELAERLRACIEESPIDTRTGPLQVTVSIGAALLRPEDTGTASLLARADQALYQAKRDGRNRVHLF